MTQTQHTPGPWRVFDALTDIEIVTDRRTANETESIVQFKGQRNAKANAYLMAAAPDLLAALIDAEVLLTASYLDHADTPNGNAVFQGLETVKAAIANAKAIS
jgi:hypothetical protein